MSLLLPVKQAALEEVLQGTADAIINTAEECTSTKDLIRCGIAHGLAMGLHAYGRVDITSGPIARLFHLPGPQKGLEHLLDLSLLEFPRENPQL